MEEQSSTAPTGPVPEVGPRVPAQGLSTFAPCTPTGPSRLCQPRTCPGLLPDQPCDPLLCFLPARLGRTRSTNALLTRTPSVHRIALPRAEGSSIFLTSPTGSPLPIVCASYERPSSSRPTGFLPRRLGTRPLLPTLKYSISFSIFRICFHR